jgi:lactate dehydrogenase-like 2-hydroxyacid dehydrogenase
MSRPDVFLPKPIPEAARVVLDREFEVLELWKAADPDAAIAAIAPRCRFAISAGHWKYDDAMLDRFPKLEIVANYGVGYDPIDTTACAKRGIVATNTPDVLNDEVADTTIALLLAAIRRIPQADRYVRSGKWLQAAFPLTPTLIGRMVGIVGLGRIGLTIAKRLEAFAIRGIAYHSRTPKADAPYAYYANLVDMARDCDVLIVITPGGAATRKLVNRDVLEALGPGGCLVNVARGTVVDEDALVECLQTGKLGMAGLDVFEHEPKVPEALFALDNVVLAPHVGSATHHTRDAMGMLVVENLVAWKNGKAPVTPVPETPVPAGRT